MNRYAWLIKLALLSFVFAYVALPGYIPATLGPVAGLVVLVLIVWMAIDGIRAANKIRSLTEALGEPE